MFTEQFNAPVKKLQLFVRPVVYRPILIFAVAEVLRPGYSQLSGCEELSRLPESEVEVQISARTATSLNRPGVTHAPSCNRLGTFGSLSPTVFNAIDTAQCTTHISNLPAIHLTHN